MSCDRQRWLEAAKPEKWVKVEPCFLKVAALQHKKEISYAMVS